DDLDSDDEESGTASQSSGGETDPDKGTANPNAAPSARNPRSMAEVESDNEDASDEEETGINSFNGHRWESRRNLEFQVIWIDGNVTWEPLANVNDCAAMEEYLAHRDIDDPLLLSKRKFLISPTPRAKNA
ncbi:hypothetical protein B0H17DRAFT_1150423, partial [Mycena rosella]